MDCNFSETQFAFGLMRELMQKFSPTKGYFIECPSTVVEGKTGYDLKMYNKYTAIFLQFKIPEFISYSKGKEWNDFKMPYYRFKIWPDSTSQQHNTLVKLANQKVNPTNKVFYVSPGFYTEKDFNMHYSKGSIYSNTVFVSCRYLPTISGDDKHCVTYTKNTHGIYKKFFHSEPYEVNDKEESDDVIKNIQGYDFIQGEVLLERLKGFFSDLQYDGKSVKNMNLHEICNGLQATYGITTFIICKQ